MRRSAATIVASDSDAFTASITMMRSNVAQRYVSCAARKLSTSLSVEITPSLQSVSSPHEKDTAPEGKKLSASCSTRSSSACSLMRAVLSYFPAGKQGLQAGQIVFLRTFERNH